MDVERIRLRIKATEIFSRSRQSAGSRTITIKMREAGEVIGRYKVRRLMKEASQSLLLIKPQRLSDQTYQITSIVNSTSRSPTNGGVATSRTFGSKVGGCTSLLCCRLESLWTARC